MKKRTQRARKFANVTSDVAEYRNRNENELRDDREIVAKAAREVLSPRQRKILELTADGWTIPQVAIELAAPVERISDEKYKAIKKLQHFMGAA